MDIQIGTPRQVRFSRFCTYDKTNLKHTYTGHTIESSDSYTFCGFKEEEFRIRQVRREKSSKKSKTRRKRSRPNLSYEIFKKPLFARMHLSNKSETVAKVVEENDEKREKRQEEEERGRYRRGN